MTRGLSAGVVGVWLGCALCAQGQDYFGNKPPIAKLPAMLPGPGTMPTAAPAGPPPGMMPNPYLAQAIARTLRESGQLSQYRINVYSQDGVVDLVGEVADENQRETVVRLLRMVPGIVSVRDWLQTRRDVNTVGAQMPAMFGVEAAQAPMQNPMQNQVPAPQPVNPPAGQQPAPRIDGQMQIQEPLPIFQAPSGPNPAIQPPPMPPYAWPTVAPYNNYSRVAYPNTYPYEQWPFIGPMYPFPKVPLGWRSVSLTWEDGYWWYSRNPTGHDWWRVRYH